MNFDSMILFSTALHPPTSPNFSSLWCWSKSKTHSKVKICRYMFLFCLFNIIRRNQTNDKQLQCMWEINLMMMLLSSFSGLTTRIIDSILVVHKNIYNLCSLSPKLLHKYCVNTVPCALLWNFFHYIFMWLWRKSGMILLSHKYTEYEQQKKKNFFAILYLQQQQ